MTLADRLRSETRPQHTALESVLGFARSREEHVEQLRRFLGFIEPWERRIAQSPLAEMYRGREKTAWLKADLTFWGLSVEEIAALPRCEHLPAVESWAEAVGSMYVIEGSTLGGQTIARHLEETFGVSAGQGYRYFLSYGELVPQKWREFRAYLMIQSSTETDDAVVASAAATFSAMHEWFAREPMLR